MEQHRLNTCGQGELSDELADKADKAEAPGSNATEAPRTRDLSCAMTVLGVCSTCQSFRIAQDLAAKVETKSQGAAASSVKVPGYMSL